MSDYVSEFLNKKTSKNLTILYHDFYLIANSIIFRMELLRNDS